MARSVECSEDILDDVIKGMKEAIPEAGTLSDKLALITSFEMFKAFGSLHGKTSAPYSSILPLFAHVFFRQTGDYYSAKSGFKYLLEKKRKLSPVQKEVKKIVQDNEVETFEALLPLLKTREQLKALCSLHGEVTETTRCP